MSPEAWAGLERAADGLSACIRKFPLSLALRIARAIAAAAVAEGGPVADLVAARAQRLQRDLSGPEG